MTRKHSISKTALTSGVIFTGINVFDSIEKQTKQPSNQEIKINLDKNPELQDAGGYIYTKNLIVINTGEEYVALSKKCTHHQCTVEYEADFKELSCPCQGSAYSLNGKVLNGPASGPLKSFNLRKVNNTLKINH